MCLSWLKKILLDQQPNPHQYRGDEVQEHVLTHGRSQFGQVVGVLERAQRSGDGEDEGHQTEQRPGGEEAESHAGDEGHVGE